MFTEWRERRRYEKAVNDPAARRQIASEVTSPYLLSMMAYSSDLPTLLGVLENPNVTEKQVDSVACEDGFPIASAVLHHPLCSEWAIEKFAKSKDYRIRLQVAQNAELSEAVRNILLEDRIPTIRAIASKSYFRTVQSGS